MGKKIVKSNFHVKVYPRSPGDYGIFSIGGQMRKEEDEIAICEEIAADVRRHVDNLPSGRGRGVTVAWDEEEVCEHCGSKWNPTCFGNNCCEKDEIENGF